MTVKIDGIAASAASVIAMAGTKVLISSGWDDDDPKSGHHCMGDSAEMQKAIEMLGSVKIPSSMPMRSRPDFPVRSSPIS